tara:strand:+ start:170 stop:601 length:432 start_codon:yes stop_codon:yes gene_type:complete
MTQGLYIAEVQGKDTYSKPGITEDIGSRIGGYSKGGNHVTIHFLCVARPGLDGLIRTLEEDGKVYWKKYFSKFNGYHRTEYINIQETGITVEILEEYYRKKIKLIPGIFIVKKEHLPLTRESPDLKDFMKNALKHPKKYLEGF